MNIFYIIFIKFAFIFSEETSEVNICPDNTPFSFEEKSCVYQYNIYDNSMSYEIIKEQVLNRKNPIGSYDTNINSDFSSNGDLIIESFSYDYNIRFLYGIKPNGRPLFYDEKNNEFIYQINIATQSNDDNVECTRNLLENDE